MSARADSHTLEFVFLEDVARNPGDETPVLIYADWLMEQDDPELASRGEFLRLQSVLRHGRPGDHRADLEWRARDLWWAHIESWLGPVYDAVEHFSYERGLLSVEISEDTLGRFVDELADAPAWGWIRHIGVRNGSLETLTWLSGLPRPRLVCSLDVGRKTLDRELDELPLLLELPLLEGLEELELGTNYLGDDGAVQLAAWPGAGSLRKLGLSDNGIGHAGVLALAHSAQLDALVELDLSGNLIHGDAGQELARATGLKGLKKLNVSDTYLDWQDVAALQQRFEGADIQSMSLRPPYYDW
jgi:uncharacterized protein (TIGR02996 family)